MPRIFDNIALGLLPALRETLDISQRSDFCVGYFNLHGWKAIDALIEKWPGGAGQQCRLLVGMQTAPQEELREALSITTESSPLDNQTALRFKKKLAEDFRNQLTLGAPTNKDEAGLRRLARQLKEGKVVVKLFLRHTLHAKLYLCFRSDPNNPITGFQGSSNLTFAGLSKQGELNVDVLDQDATQKLAKWFEDHWGDRWCIDITKELIQVIEEKTKDVLDQLGVKMKGILKPKDYEPHESNAKQIRWRNTAQWARNTMANEDGRMKEDSPNGIWEISDKGRAWLKKQ